MKNRSHWVPRSDGGFYTLGTAAYLDAVTSIDKYLLSARCSNEILIKSFPSLYDRLGLLLSSQLEETVILDKLRAIPGFHIFEVGGQSFEKESVAQRSHFDLQWLYAYPNEDVVGTFSFTLLIEAPNCGATMAVWELTYKDALFGANPRKHAKHYIPRLINYAPGRLLMHDGLILHAIGPTGSGRAGLRITLQGHGIRFDKRWRLYW
ncbi:hypothetical protein [Acidisoma sp. S159]|uniref:hypothetical protein n=1 Tax=Acidisoma sp. S159 TaxID=1747225 RepID=UPI00131C9FF8|nr:hypothetical protein [Acidisoma sp. S159]